MIPKEDGGNMFKWGQHFVLILRDATPLILLEKCLGALKNCSIINQTSWKQHVHLSKALLHVGSYKVQMNLISAFLQHEEPLSAQVWPPSAFAGQVAAAVP